jgi:hypothetical protein
MTLKQYFEAINKDNKVFALSVTYPSGHVNNYLHFEIEGDKFVIFCIDRGGPYDFDANQEIDLLNKHSIIAFSEDDEYKVKLTFLSANIIPHPPEID